MKLKRIQWVFYIFGFFLLWVQQAFAQAPAITYHGRLIDGVTNLPVTETAVQFRVQIRTPGAENCLMFEEQHTKNLATTDGIFVIGLNNGTGTRVDTSGFSVEQVFSNKQSFTFGAGECLVGTTYTPAYSDARRMLVYFNDGTFVGWEPLPSQTLAYTPMAVESLNVGGFPASSLLRFVDGSGNPFNTSPLSNAQYTTLTQLIAGTSPLYVQAGGIAGGFSGALVGDVTGTQGATVVSRIQSTPVVATVPTVGQYLIFNGTQWAPAAGSGGTVQNVSSTNAYLTVGGTPTLNPTLTVNVGVAANTVAAGDDSRIVGAFQTATALGGDLSGTLPNPTVATVGGRSAASINTSVGDTIAATNLSTPSTIVRRDGSGDAIFNGVQATNFSGRNFYFFDGTNTNSINIRAPAAAIGSNLTWTLPNSNGTNGFVLGTDGAGNLAWQSPTAGSVTGVAASSPLASSGGFSPTISIQVANTTQDGYLASADWNTFNNKMSTALNNGLVWVGNAGNVATARNLNVADLKSTVAGDWFNAGLCAAGEVLSYSLVTDQVTCQTLALTSAQVTTALTYTPLNQALPDGNIYVGNGANVATGVAMSGDTTIANTGAVTISNNAVTTAKINNLAVTDAKINDVDWGKVTGTPTTIAGYGILDAVLINAGGISDMRAGAIATRPVAGTIGRIFISTDSQEVFIDNGVIWVRVGSHTGLGGTVTNVTGTAPISVATGTTTPVVSMTQSNTTTDGYLSSADWNTFNNKLSTTLNSAQIWVGNAGNTATPITMSGDATIDNAGALTIANNAVTTSKINNLAVTNAKINDVAWGKVTGTPTTIAGYGILDAILINGGGMADMIAGTFAARPAPSVAGRIYFSFDTQEIFRDNGAAWVRVASSNGLGGTVTSITAGAGLTGGTITTTGTIGLDTELAGLNGLATTGVVKRTGAGAYTASAVDLATADVTGTLPVGNGGTGAATLTTGSLLVGNGTSPVNALTAGSVGNVIYATGVNAWSSGTPTAAGLVDLSSAQTVSGAKTFSSAITAGAIGAGAGAGGQVRFSEPSGAGSDYVGFRAPDAIAANLIWTLPPTDGGAGQVLQTNGAGALGWYTPTVGTVTSVTSANGDITVATTTTTPVLTLNAGTGANQIVRLNGTSELPAVSGANLTNLNAGAITTGTLPVDRGGTGVATIGAGNIMIGNGTGAVTSLAAGGNGNVIYGTGVASYATGSPDTAGLVDKTSVQSISGAKTFGATVRMSNQNVVEFAELSGSGTDAVSVRAPTNVTTPYTLTLPPAVGTNGQMMITDATGNLSWSTPNVGTVTSVSGTAPISVATGTSTPVISMTQSNTTTDGYLSSADWNIFNNKLNLSGGTMTGAIAMGSNNITGTGNILMSPNRSLQISQLTNAEETTLIGTLVAGDEGRTWYNATTNEIKFWDGAGVQVLGVVGAGITQLNGLTNGTQTFAIGTAGTDFAINSAGSTHTFNIPSASVANRGLLTSADWTTFNSKLSTTLNSSLIWVGNAGNAAAPVALSGDATLSNTGALTLANTAVTGGSYGGASAVPTFTVDGKGRLTAAGSTAYQDATAGQKGIVQIGSNINVAAGTISLDASSITGALTYTPLNQSLTNGQIYVGSAGNIATGVALSGDATIINTGALTIANNAVTTAKINNLAVTDAKINDVAWGKITATPTTISGYGITNAVTNLGIGATTNITSFQAGNTAGRPAAGTAGRMYVDTQAGITYRDNGTTWDNVGSANGLGGTVTSITAGAGLTGGTITTSGTIGLDTELAGLNGLATTGIMRRTGAGAYSTGAVDLTTADVTGVLPVASGGTGAATIGAGNIVIGNGTGAVTSLAAGGNGNVIYGTGVSSFATGTPDTAGLVDKTSVQSISGAKTFGATVRMSNQNVVEFAELTASGTDAVTVRAPTNVTTPYTLTLPPAVGTNGQMMITDATGNLSWSTPNVGTVTSVSGTAPISVATGTSTPVISMTQSDTATDGYLSSTDWNTFNNKLSNSLNSALMWVGNAGNVATPVAMSGDATLANTGALTLANTAVTGGSYGSASAVPTFTVDGKGRLTAAGSTAYQDATAGQKGIVQIGSNINVAAGTISLDASSITGALTYTPLNQSLTSGQIFVGSAGNVATGVAMSGDAAIDNTGALTIANNAITTAKINNLAVTDAKINDVAWGKITATPTTIAGYGITNAVTNLGVGATSNVSSFQAGNTAGRPAAGTAGRMYVDTQAGITYRDNGTTWDNVGSAVGSGGTVTSITAGAGLTGGTITATGTIGLDAELAGLNGLATTGVVKRTGAGAYTAAAVGLATADVTGTLPVGNGGTGVATLTAGSLIVGNGAGAVNELAAGSAGNLIYGTGATSFAVGTPDTAGVVDKASVQTIAGAKTFTSAISAGAIGAGAGAGGQVRFYEPSGAGTEYVGFRAPDAIGANIVWTLPAADGSVGQVLSTNGAGTLSWTSAATGTVSSVTSANTDIGVATTTTTPVLTLNSGVGANQIVKLNVSAELPAVSGANLTNLNAGAITTGTLPVDRGGTGAATIGAGNIVIGNGTGAVTSLAAGGNGNVIYGTGVSSFATGTPDTAGLVDKTSVQSISGAKTFGATVRMSNQNVVEFAELTASGTDAVSVRAPNDVTTPYTLTLPPAVGLGGQMMITDASGNLSWATPNVGTVTSVSGTLPISVATGTSTPVISMTQSNTTTDGYLSSADWNTFNNKLGTTLNDGLIWVGNGANVAAPVAMSGDATLANTGALTLANTAVTGGSYGSASAVPTFTVDSKGRLTAAGTTAYQDATAGVKGVVQIGSNINVAAGTISLDASSITGALTYTPLNQSLTSGQIFVGSAGNVATGVAMSGDAAIDNTGALTIANNAITTAKINNLAVTDAKINDVAWGKITATPTTIAGYGITDAVRNVGVGAGNIVTTIQSGNTAGRPAAGTDGRIYMDTQAGVTYRDNGTTWNAVTGTGSVTSITAGAGLTGGTITATGTIGLDAELAGLNGLATTGVVKRTGAGAYSAAAVGLATADVTGTLPVGNGGTGVATLTAGSLVVGNGAGAVNELAAGSAGNLIYATGATSFASGSPDTAGVVDKTTVQTIAGAKTFTSAVSAGAIGAGAGAGGQVRFYEPSGAGTEYVGFRAPDAIGANVIWELPAADGGAGQVLSTNGAGVLSWIAGASGTVTSVTSANADIGVATTTTTPVLTLNAGTGANQIVRLNGTSELPAVSGANLTNLNAGAITSGTLPVDRGGTGVATIGAGNVMIGNGTGAITSLAAGGNGNVIYGTGVASYATGTPDTAGLVDKSSVQSISGAKTFGATVRMSNQNVVEFAELTASGTDAVTVRAPSNVTAPYTLTLPAAVGSNTNILSTDATGNLSWVANLMGTTITSGSLVVGNGTGTVNTLAAGSTGNLIYATSATTWASGTPTQAGVAANGGNSFAGAMTVGTNDANTLNLETNNVSRVAIDTNGGVQVNGQAWSQVATSAVATPLTWDTNLSNTMRWTIATGTITTNIHNMKPGASYMLVVAGAGTGTNTINCFSDAGVTALPTGFVPANGNRVTGTLNKTIYTLMSDGQNCLITWITGY